MIQIYICVYIYIYIDKGPCQLTVLSAFILAPLVGIVEPHCGFTCMSPMADKAHFLLWFFFSTFSFAYSPLALFFGGEPVQVLCLFFYWLI